MLTNDGELTQLLTHPSHGVVKTYLAEVEGVPAPGARPRAARGRRARRRARPRRRGCSVVQRARRDRARSRSRSTRVATGRCGACARRSATRCAGWCAPASARCTTGELAPGRVAGAVAPARCARSTKRRRPPRARQRPRTPRTHPANLASPDETAGAARRDHVRRGLQGRDRRQDAAAGEGDLARNELDARRHREHHLHRHPRPHRRVPGHRGPRRARARRRRRCSARRSRPCRTACPAASGCSCTATPTGRATSCTTCSSRARPRCAPTSRRRLTRAGVSTAPNPSRSSAPASSEARSASRSRRAGYEVRGFDHDADARPRRARRSARSTTLAAERRRRGGRRRPHRGRGAGRAASPRWSIEALDAGARAGHRRRLGEGAGRRARSRRRAPSSRPRFVGGHPMAGSEQDGLDGAERRPLRGRDLGAHADRAHRPGSVRRRCATCVATLGAEAIAVTPELHDALVAVVSHVPQLAASTLMNVADARRRASTRSLLRLAAGGFRDMTRIASSHPGDLARHLPRQPRRDRRRARRLPRRARRACAASSPAATAPRCSTLLETRARGPPQPARRACPSTSQLVELRVPVPDRAGRARRGHDAGRRARRQHRRPRDRALARGPQRCARAGGRRARRRRVRGRARRARLPRRPDAAAHERRRRARRSRGRRPLRGRLRVPGDKGISHRALLFAAMADGRSRVVGLAGGDDVARTARRARAARRRRSPSPAPAVTIDGRGVDALTEPGGVVDCGNSGTTMRTARAACSPAGRSSACSPATTSLVAAADGAGSSSRCGRWARTSTAAPTARCAPLVDPRRRPRTACAHELAVASGR